MYQLESYCLEIVMIILSMSLKHLKANLWMPLNFTVLVCWFMFMCRKTMNLTFVFFRDWGTQFENEFHYLHPHHDKFDDGDMPNSTIGGDNAINNIDADKMDDMEVRMDLTDDLLHMV